jgi:hypothetical protein
MPNNTMTSVRDAVRVFNKHVLNPAMMQLAGRKYWYAAVIRHTGRRSGKNTFPLFPTWADSSRDRTLDVLRKSLAMTQSGSVALLADGHGDRCYRGQSEISALLGAVLDDHMAFEEALAEVFATADGLTPGEVYDRFRQLPDRPVVRKYLDLEYPHTPPSLQNVMVTTMRQLGYRSSGPRRHQRFHRLDVSVPHDKR